MEERGASEERGGGRLGDRFGAAARGARELGYDAVTRPGGLSDQAHSHLRRWFRKVWDARGGGLYAVGFAVTFLYLEIKELFLDDIPGFLTLESYAPGELIGFFIEFLIDTLMNTIAAFLWPVTVIEWYPPYSVFLLIGAFLLFPKYLKPHIEEWLFRDADHDGSERERKNAT